MTAEPAAEAGPPAPKKSRAWIVTAIVFVLALDLAFFWQRVGGAWRSEFGGHPDEGGHYVTGLFVRDALLALPRFAAQKNPGAMILAGKNFADDYYAHYPKVGLGVWPPFFYLVQSAWTLPFSPSRGSILLLMCALAATVAVQLFRVLREEFGIAPAAFGAVLLLSLPLVREYYSMVMAETLSAALMFGAVLAFGDFLDREKRGDALWFGVLAALAILTKGTGLALALAVLLALLFTRRFQVLRRPAFWAAVAIIVLVAGPWTWATRNLGKGGWLQPNPSLSFTMEALPYYVKKLGLALCLVPVVFLAIGVWVKARGSSPHQGRWAAAGALIVAVVIFQSIAPVGLEARHLIPALPAAMMFIVAGLDWQPRGKTAREPNRRFSLALPFPWLIAVLLLALAANWPFVGKRFSGFAPLADAMLREAAPADVTLVSSDARGEGMFISEVAMHEPRPGHTILRASKALASSTWSGSGYAPLFKDDDEVLAFLTNGKIQYLAIDDAVPEDKRREHQDQFKRVIEQHSDTFWLVASAEMIRDGEPQLAPVRLYKIRRKN